MALLTTAVRFIMFMRIFVHFIELGVITYTIPV